MIHLISETSQSSSSSDNANNGVDMAQKGCNLPFPYRVHEMLEAVEKEGLEHIVSWKSHGRAFIVHKPSLFVESVLPRFFSQTKYASFQRQLNLYGFNRFQRGKDKGAYFHVCFVRGHSSLVRHMVRSKIKGSKAATARETMEQERNFDFYNPIWKDHFEPCMPGAKARKSSSDKPRSDSPSSSAKPKSDISLSNEKPESDGSSPSDEPVMEITPVPLVDPGTKSSATAVVPAPMFPMSFSFLSLPKDLKKEPASLEFILDFNLEDDEGKFEGQSFHLVEKDVKPQNTLCACCTCYCGLARV